MFIRLSNLVVFGKPGTFCIIGFHALQWKFGAKALLLKKIPCLRDAVLSLPCCFSNIMYSVGCWFCSKYFNMPCHTLCALYYAMCWMLFSILVFGSSRYTRVWNQDWQHQIIDEQVKPKISEDPFLVINDQGKHKPIYQNYSFKAFGFLLYIAYDSNVFLVDRQICPIYCMIPPCHLYDMIHWS